MTLGKSKFGYNFRSPLIKQAVFMAFVLSSVLFILVSTFSSYRHYVDGQKKIISEISYLEKVLEIPLRTSLWHINGADVKEILNVLAQNPHVSRAWIENSKEIMSESSSGKRADWVTLRFPLTYGKSLGTLMIALSKDQFISDLTRKIISSSLNNLVRFIFLAFCIVVVFSKKIIEPVIKIQEMTKQFNDEHLSPILGAGVKFPTQNSKNEIEALSTNIHMLQENFKSAFIMQKKAKEAQLETELQLEKEKQKIVLSQRLETIGQITSQVAHDFGNLIMIINAKTKALDRRLKDEMDFKETEAIRKAASRAQGLIKKILSMTRTQNAEPILFDPFQNLIEIQDLLRMSIGSENLLNIETDGSHCMIHVEPTSFENVIINLCINARDAMPSGGKISISILSQIRNNQEFVVIAVKDNGQGIPEDIQLKIFNPFFTTKEVGKGSGLGLSQVQDFVQKVGGSLELSSSEEGTCFTLFLPNRASQKTLTAA